MSRASRQNTEIVAAYGTPKSDSFDNTISNLVDQFKSGKNSFEIQNNLQAIVKIAKHKKRLENLPNELLKSATPSNEDERIKRAIEYQCMISYHDELKSFNLVSAREYAKAIASALVADTRNEITLAVDKVRSGDLNHKFSFSTSEYLNDSRVNVARNADIKDAFVEGQNKKKESENYLKAISIFFNPSYYSAVNTALSTKQAFLNTSPTQSKTKDEQIEDLISDSRSRIGQLKTFLERQLGGSTFVDEEYSTVLDVLFANIPNKFKRTSNPNEFNAFELAKIKLKDTISFKDTGHTNLSDPFVDRSKVHTTFSNIYDVPAINFSNVDQIAIGESKDTFIGRISSKYYPQYKSNPILQRLSGLAMVGAIVDKLMPEKFPIQIFFQEGKSIVDESISENIGGGSQISANASADFVNAVKLLFGGSDIIRFEKNELDQSPEMIDFSDSLEGKAVKKLIRIGRIIDLVAMDLNARSKITNPTTGKRVQRIEVLQNALSDTSNQLAMACINQEIGNNFGYDLVGLNGSLVNVPIEIFSWGPENCERIIEEIRKLSGDDNIEKIEKKAGKKLDKRDIDTIRRYLIFKNTGLMSVDYLSGVNKILNCYKPINTFDGEDDDLFENKTKCTLLEKILGEYQVEFKKHNDELEYNKILGMIDELRAWLTSNGINSEMTQTKYGSYTLSIGEKVTKLNALNHIFSEGDSIFISSRIIKEIADAIENRNITAEIPDNIKIFLGTLMCLQDHTGQLFSQGFSYGDLSDQVSSRLIYGMLSRNLLTAMSVIGSRGGFDLSTIEDPDRLTQFDLGPAIDLLAKNSYASVSKSEFLRKITQRYGKNKDGKRQSQSKLMMAYCIEQFRRAGRSWTYGDNFEAFQKDIWEKRDEEGTDAVINIFKDSKNPGKYIIRDHTIFEELVLKLSDSAPDAERITWMGKNIFTKVNDNVNALIRFFFPDAPEIDGKIVRLFARLKKNPLASPFEAMVYLYDRVRLKENPLFLIRAMRRTEESYAVVLYTYMGLTKEMILRSICAAADGVNDNADIKVAETLRNTKESAETFSKKNLPPEISKLLPGVWKSFNPLITDIVKYVIPDSRDMPQKIIGGAVMLAATIGFATIGNQMLESVLPLGGFIRERLGLFGNAFETLKNVGIVTSAVLHVFNTVKDSAQGEDDRLEKNEVLGKIPYFVRAIAVRTLFDGILFPIFNFIGGVSLYTIISSVLTPITIKFVESKIIGGPDAWIKFNMRSAISQAEGKTGIVSPFTPIYRLLKNYALYWRNNYSSANPEDHPAFTGDQMKDSIDNALRLTPWSILGIMFYNNPEAMKTLERYNYNGGFKNISAILNARNKIMGKIPKEKISTSIAKEVAAKVEGQKEK